MKARSREVVDTSLALTPTLSRTRSLMPTAMRNINDFIMDATRPQSAERDAVSLSPFLINEFVVTDPSSRPSLERGSETSKTLVQHH